MRINRKKLLELESEYRNWGHKLGLVRTENEQEVVNELLVANDVAYIYRCTAAAVTKWARKGIIASYRNREGLHLFSTRLVFEHGLQQIEGYGEHLGMIEQETDQTQFDVWSEQNGFMAPNRAGQPTPHTLLTSSEVAGLFDESIQRVNEWVHEGYFVPLKLSTGKTAHRRYFAREVFYYTQPESS